MKKQELLDYKINIGTEYYGAYVVRELPIREYSTGAIARWFECKCKCGKEFVIRLESLIKPHPHLCLDCQHKVYITPKDTPQYQYPRLWDIYKGMLYRCYKAKQNTTAWKNYGGRGITVCKEWQESFLSFVNWALQNGYHHSLSIDRINVNGNYEPSNCRWATAKIQAKNQRARKSIFNVVINGKVLNLKTVSEVYHIPYQRLRRRYQRGLRGEDLLKEPPHLYKCRSFGFV